MRNHRLIIVSGAVILIALAYVVTPTVAAWFYQPSMTATKDDTLVIDNDSDSQADPGDRIQYEVTITNNGVADATGVTFSDTVDSNTTTVPGSIQVSPVAIDDGPYDVLGNVSLQVAASGVLANDYLGQLTPPAPAALTTGTFATTQGGSITLNADGSFEYFPPAGYQGADSYTYTLTNAVGSSNGVISFTVSDVCWFIDGSAAGPGTGTYADPFSSIANFNAANGGGPTSPAAGDIVFIDEGTYTDGINLLNQQVVLGNGLDIRAELDAAGLSIPGYGGQPNNSNLNASPPSGVTRPTLAPGAANAVNLAADNTVRGLNVGDTGVGAGFDGAAVGNLTVNTLAISGTGSAFDIGSGGTLDVTVDSIQVTSTTDYGVRLNNVTGGAFTVTGNTAISTAPDAGITLNQVGSVVNFGSGAGNTTTINNVTGGYGVEVRQCTNAITFQNLTVSNVTQAVAQTEDGNGIPTNEGDGDAVFLVDNTGAGFSFDVLRGTFGNTIAGNAFELRNSRDVTIGNNTDPFPSVDINGAGTAGPTYSGVHSVNGLGSLTINNTRFSNINAVAGQRMVDIVANANTLNAVIENSQFLDVANDGRETTGIYAYDVVGGTSITNLSVLGDWNAASPPATPSCYFAEIDDYNIYVVHDSPGTTATVTVDGCYFARSTTATVPVNTLYFETAGNSSMDLTVTDNRMSTNNDALAVYVPSGANTGVINVDVFDNLFYAVRGEGMYFNIQGGSDANLDIHDNAMQLVWDTGIYVTSAGFNLRTDIEIQDNAIQVTDAWQYGVYLSASANTRFAGLVEDNTISNNTLRATLYVRQRSSQPMDVTARGVPAGSQTLTNSAVYDSFYAWADSGAPLCLDMIGNTLSDPLVLNVDGGQVMNVVQADAATLSTVNGGATVTVTGAPTYGGAACASPVLYNSLGEWHMVERPADAQVVANVLPLIASHRADYAPAGAVVANTDAFESDLTLLVDRVTRLMDASTPVSTPADEPTYLARYTPADATWSPAGLAYGMRRIGAPISIGTLPPGESVTIIWQVDVNAPLDSDLTQVCNQGTVSGTNFADVLTDDPDVVGGLDPTCTPVDVPTPPTMSKAFADDPIEVTASTTMTITLTNVDAANTLSGVGFTDTLPVAGGGELAFTGINAATTCDDLAYGGSILVNPGNDTITVSGIDLGLAGGGSDSCTVVMDVQGNTVGGPYTNTTGNVSTNEVNPVPPVNASDDITVTVTAPTIDKAFGAAEIGLTDTTTLTFTVTNTATSALTNVSFSDVLPASPLGGLTYTATAISGTCSALPGFSSGLSATNAANDTLNVSGFTLGGSASCTVVAEVIGNSAGTYNNVSSAVSSTEVTGTDTAADSITVTDASLTILKAFSTSPVDAGTDVTLTFTVINPHPFAVTGVSFSDTLPAPLDGIAFDNAPASVGGTCVTSQGANVVFTTTGGATLPNTVTADSFGLAALGGGTSSCTVTVTVQTYAAATYNNLSGVVTADQGTGTDTAAATLVVNVPEPTISKAFGTTPIGLTDTTTLTFTVTNNAAIALTNVSFNDVLPNTPAGGLTVTATAISGTCSALPGFSASRSTTNAANDTLNVSGFTLGAGANCTVIAEVIGNSAGTYNNVSSVVSSNEATGTTTATDTITVTDADPTISKAFSSATVPVGTDVTLTFTVTNPHPFPLTGMSFADTLPVPLDGIAFDNAPASVGGTCVTSQGANVVFTTTGGATLPNTVTADSFGLDAAGGTTPSCTVTVTVQTNAAGNYNNLSGAVLSDQGNGTVQATDSLQVTVPEPMISKAFTDSSIDAGTSTTLTFTVTNYAAIALTGAAFSDQLPVGAPPEAAFDPVSTGGTCLSAPFNGGASVVTTAQTNDTLNVTGMVLGASGGGSDSCTVTVTVDTYLGGTLNNVSSVVTSTEVNGTTTATDTLTINVPEPTISKVFTDSSINVGTSTTLTFTVTNTSAIALTGAAFSDQLPVGGPPEAAFDPVSTGGTCLSAPFGGSGSVVTTAQTNDTLNVTGMVLGASGGGSDSCTVTVTVDAYLGGTLNNVSSVVTSTEVTGTTTASDTLTIVAPEPTISKVFTDSSINVGSSTTLTFTVTNTSAIALTGAAFSDVLPVGGPPEAAFDPATVGGTCLAAPYGGSASVVTTAQTNDTLNVTGMAFSAAGGGSDSCTVTVTVEAYLGGTLNNVSSVVTSNEITGTTTASDTLEILAPEPTISKQFAPGQINMGETSTLTFEIINTADIALTGGQFEDILPAAPVTGGLNFTGAVTGTCLAAPFGGTADPFGSVNAPNDRLYVHDIALDASGGANDRCTVIVDVMGNNGGAYANQSSVVTTNEIVGTSQGEDTLRVNSGLGLMKTFSPDAIDIGQTTILSFTLSNNSALALTNVAFEDALPVTAAGELAYLPDSIDGTCLNAPYNGVSAFSTTQAADDTLSINGISMDASGGNDSCILFVTVVGNAEGLYENESSLVTSDQGDSVNPAVATLTVGEPEVGIGEGPIIRPEGAVWTPPGEGAGPLLMIFDPALSKLGVLQPGQLGLPGETITWTVKVYNNGGIAGTNIVITDVLRPELRIDGAESDMGTVTIDGQTVRIVIDKLEPGQTATIRIVTTVLGSPADGMLVNDVALMADDGVTRAASAVVSVVTTLPSTGYPPQD
ncbi:MAG: DUF11 domain-containing protein [Anaerolineae bacterium]|nr:DUF11 domain-containing protein [Anaerolineae bacterium]